MHFMRRGVRPYALSLCLPKTSEGAQSASGGRACTTILSRRRTPPPSLSRDSVFQHAQSRGPVTAPDHGPGLDFCFPAAERPAWAGRKKGQQAGPMACYRCARRFTDPKLVILCCSCTRLSMVRAPGGLPAAGARPARGPGAGTGRRVTGPGCPPCSCLARGRFAAGRTGRRGRCRARSGFARRGLPRRLSGHRTARRGPRG